MAKSNKPQTIPAAMFVRWWESSETFEEFAGKAQADGTYYFTPAAAKQRAAKYRSKGVPLKKYPRKERTMHDLDYTGLTELCLDIKNA